jgi:DNA (cytosine-5)-methyltransferase 1
MRRPRLLDLFCGAGGASVGYHRAGFDVTGVDLAPQPNYPYSFFQGDALAAVAASVGYDAIHASPPCQAYSMSTNGLRNGGKEYVDLLPRTRELLEASGLPWVIENVPGAPMRPDLVICGCQVGLELRRVRWFETSWQAFQLTAPHNHPRPVVSVVGHGTPRWVREALGYNPSIHDYRAAMGIDWMNRGELSQAIPPEYTEVVGGHLLEHLSARSLPAPAGAVS